MRFRREVPGDVDGVRFSFFVSHHELANINRLHPHTPALLTSGDVLDVLEMLTIVAEEVDARGVPNAVEGQTVLTEGGQAL